MSGLKIPLAIIILVITLMVGGAASQNVQDQRLATLESDNRSAGQALRDMRQDLRDIGQKLDTLIQRGLPK